jgi:hypothetical protein
MPGEEITMNGGIQLVLPTVHVRARTIRGAIIRGALPALAGALVLAGCGGGGGGSVAASASASVSSSSSAGLSAFETCLKQHGVTVSPSRFARPTGSFSPRAFPTGSFSPGAFPTGSARPRPSFTGTEGAAFQACAKYAPAGFAGGANRAISSSALAAFKSCLAANGVKVTGNTAGAVLSQLRNSTGKTEAAVRTCQVLLQPAAPTPAPSS